MRKTTPLFAGLAALIALGVALPVGAQTRRPDPGPVKVEYRKKTVYDFDADEVLGTLKRPDGELLVGLRRGALGSMLKPRASFVPEIVRSAER